MEALGKALGFHSKSRGQPLEYQYSRSPRKERILSIRGLRFDFKLGLEGSSWIS